MIRRMRGRVLLLAIVASAAINAQPAELRIIDVHVHADGERAEKRGELFRQWREAGVSGGVSMLPADASVAAVRDRRLIHCAGIPALPDVQKLEQDLKAGRFRCMKVYLGYVHQYASDTRYTPVYRLAAKYKVPVIFHTGDTASKKAKLKYADPLTIDEVAVDHPGTTFVIAHLGNPWIASAAEVAYKNPNVYVDASALLTGDMSKLDPADVEEYVVDPIRWAFGYMEDPRKLMFGSDWPLVNVPAYVEAYKRAIPKEHWPDVFRNNAVRVFGLDESF